MSIADEASARVTRGKQDIRRVVTDLSTGAVYLRIDTWQRFREGFFIVRFDSGGDRDFDRVLEIYKGRRFTCLLEKAFRGGPEPGEKSATVGPRVRASGRWRAACRAGGSPYPQGGALLREVAGNRHDRAPNAWLYRWL